MGGLGEARGSGAHALQVPELCQVWVLVFIYYKNVSILNRCQLCMGLFKAPWRQAKHLVPASLEGRMGLPGQDGAVVLGGRPGSWTHDSL